jgi:EAL domain-containing protein (putative c-di-GMP-specific phosphodiesterase class I)
MTIGPRWARCSSWQIETLQQPDRAFVGNVASSECARELTRAVVSLGKALGLKVLAEGVETGWQHDVSI